MSPQEAADYLVMLIWEWPNYDEKRHEAFRLAITALERAAKAEPVAWRVRIPRGPDAYEIRLASTAEQLREMEAKWPLALVEPLYASPPQDRPASQVRDIPEGWQPIETAPRDGTEPVATMPPDEWVRDYAKKHCTVKTGDHWKADAWNLKCAFRAWAAASPPAPEKSK